MAELKNRLQCELTEHSAVEPSVRFQSHLACVCAFSIIIFFKDLQATRVYRDEGDYLIDILCGRVLLKT